ncbi:MAG TPA: hypothetical protein VGX23_25550 [Actinocrinis sp.]|nr:hypothetical protein [Actinocrinis sp.]
MRNASFTAGRINRDDLSYDASPQAPSVQFFQTRQLDAVVLRYMGARRLLARVICTGGSGTGPAR